MKMPSLPNRSRTRTHWFPLWHFKNVLLLVNLTFMLFTGKMLNISVDTDGEGSMAGERAQTQPNGQDEGSFGIDLLQKEEGGSAPETVLQDNMPEPHEALPSPDVPFTNVGSSSETPQSVSAVQPELRNNVLLSPISEEPAVDGE